MKHTPLVLAAVLSIHGANEARWVQSIFESLGSAPGTHRVRGSAFPSITQTGEDKASPFDGLRWSSGLPEVDVEGTWYRPVSIDGVSVASILEFCEKRWPGKREKRFGEDLVEAMALMGHGTGRSVSLDLVRLADGVKIELAAVAMTKAKRQAIWASNQTHRSSGRVSPAAPSAVPVELARRDLERFGAGLRDRFAYVSLKGIDLEAELESLSETLRAEVDVASLANALNRLLMRFGDGHARVEAPRPRDPGRHLPFLLDTAQGGIVAFDPDRTRFVDRSRPYVQAIDGDPVAHWIGAMSEQVVAGSPQLVQHRALRALREIERAREAKGYDASDVIELTLSSKPKGGRKKTITLDLQPRRPTYGTWPRTETRLVTAQEAGGAKGGIGVIRLAEMDDELIPEVRRAMQRFRGTAGLILDVRGNGGGQRGLCAALAGYLVDEVTGPVVGNVAAYRLAPAFREDHLGGSRLLYRADDPHWSGAQSRAIADFAATFEPEWKLPDGFSEWHYLVLDRTGHPDEFHYDRPVIVLTDEASFSATDIFAAALGELSGVTLLGTATGGGSARVQTFDLPETGIRVRCASMASFQPNGQLYDGHGVAVDVEVERAPADLLLGGGDAQMQAAIRLISESGGSPK
ncbi:carboxy-terminal protease [Planctomycetes bacterium Poly30]|uniref:Carboxy-terminal protease n=1 Tax=Saltatorellus ferox TaxID=2528018 RepID=A0A518ERI5_9BACT|nr:carboxy-terminal protease [Planctomycetes bacterium Poly30]